MKIIAVQDYLKQTGIKLSCENFAGELKFGDFIFYRDKRDLLVGKVAGTPRNAPDSIKVNDGKIEKVMTKEEIISQEKIQNGEKERVIKAQNSANKVKLAMKFFASKVSFKGNITSLLFVSEQAVDFRELLKLLSKDFGTRIHLQRCSKREQVKIMGGVGQCGRAESCCHFINLNQGKISMDSVRDQGIQIKGNQNIFGISGGIKGCMNYEVETYRERNRYMPHIQQSVKYDGQDGRVVGVDILNSKVKVFLPSNNTIVAVSVQDVTYKNQRKFEAEPAIKISAELEIDGENI
jgi:cell fate regulator YaaT (PSP1 superfamily)